MISTPPYVTEPNRGGNAVGECVDCREPVELFRGVHRVHTEMCPCGCSTVIQRVCPATPWLTRSISVIRSLVEPNPFLALVRRAVRLR